MREIEVTKDSSREAGSCNACTAHTTGEGTAEHTVHIITLRYGSLRVCGACLEELLEKLAEAYLESP